MKISTFIKRLLTLSLITLVSMQASQAELLDRIVAVVNNDIILQSEFESEMRLVLTRLQTQQQQMPPRAQIAQQVLEQMIVKTVQKQRARNVGLRIPDQMVNEALGTIAQRNGSSLNNLPETLAAEGIDYAQFREQIREQLTIQQLSQRELGANLQVSDAEVDRLIAQGNSNQEYFLKHLLIAIDANASAELLKQKQEQIEKLQTRISTGEDFSKLAIAYSNGTTALQGGELGWRTLAQMPSIFTDKVRSLQLNQVSEVIRSPSGFHLILVEQTRGNELPPQIVEQYSVRHILIRDSDLSSDVENKAKLKTIKTDIAEGLSFFEAARLNSEDPGSATRGGELGWAVPDLYDPNFASVIRTSAVGVVSEPFKSQFGWHILEVVDKRQENMAKEVLRNRARNALREQKFEEESLLWMQRLRDEAYVEYRL